MKFEQMRMKVILHIFCSKYSEFNNSEIKSFQYVKDNKP